MLANGVLDADWDGNGTKIFAQHSKVKTDQKRYRSDGNQFIKDEFKYDRQQYHSPHHSSSYEYINGRVCIQLKTDGKEYAFDFESDKEYFILHYNCKHDILVLAFDKFTGYRFYSKTGSLIWEYKVKQGFVSDVEGVSFTDDIVIISQNNRAMPDNCLVPIDKCR